MRASLGVYLLSQHNSLFCELSKWKNHFENIAYVEQYGLV